MPIHLILAPGEGASHSQILWWQSDHHHVPIPNEDLNGGRWAWSPTYNACDFSNFTELGLPSTGENIFCAGHTLLGDGNILVSGGTEPGSENGITSQKVFDTLRGEWANPAPPDMKWRRWYPSTTELGDGRILVTSGSRAPHIYVLGGRTTGNTLASDSLHRLLLAEQGVWDPSVRETGGSQQWPEARSGATMVPSSAGFGGFYLFGGEDGSEFKSDVWWLKTHGSPYQRSDQFFSSRALLAEGSEPQVRTRHSAAVRSDTMIVFGGVSNSGSEEIYDDVWVGWQTGVDSWKWTELIVAGSHPSARFGHAAAYDADQDRMLIFGGIEGTGGALADSAVWALTLDIANQEASWDTVTIEGALRPGPRFGHSIKYDIDAFEAPHGRVDRSLVMFGGDRGGQNYTNELWRLWLHSDGTAHWSLEPDSDSDLPTPRAGHSAAIVAGTRQVYIRCTSWVGRRPRDAIPSRTRCASLMKMTRRTRRIGSN